MILTPYSFIWIDIFHSDIQEGMCGFIPEIFCDQLLRDRQDKEVKEISRQNPLT